MKRKNDNLLRAKYTSKRKKEKKHNEWRQNGKLAGNRCTRRNKERRKERTHLQNIFHKRAFINNIKTRFYETANLLKSVDQGITTDQNPIGIDMSLSFSIFFSFPDTFVASSLLFIFREIVPNCHIGRLILHTCPAFFSSFPIKNSCLLILRLVFGKHLFTIPGF